MFTIKVIITSQTGFWDFLRRQELDAKILYCLLMLECVQSVYYAA